MMTIRQIASTRSTSPSRATARAAKPTGSAGPNTSITSDPSLPISTTMCRKTPCRSSLAADFRGLDVLLELGQAVGGIADQPAERPEAEALTLLPPDQFQGTYPGVRVADHSLALLFEKCVGLTLPALHCRL